MERYRAQVECDGGPHCQAKRHVEGCYATMRRPEMAETMNEEIVSLRRQLGGAVDRAGVAEDSIAEAEHVLRAYGIAADPPRPLSQRIRELAEQGGRQA